MSTTRATTQVLPIRGMTCGGCAATLQSGLERLDGVSSASVSFATRTASVSGSLSEAVLQREVARLGFEALPSTAALQHSDGAEAELAQRRAPLAAPLARVVVAAALIDLTASGRVPCAAALFLWLGPGRALLQAALRRARSLHATMDTLVALGSGAALVQGATHLAQGASGTGAFRAASVIVTFVLVGRALEERARSRAAAGLAALTRRVPRRARVLRQGEEHEVDADQVAEGELCLVGEGQAVPVDGVVEAGASGFD